MYRDPVCCRRPVRVNNGEEIEYVDESEAEETTISNFTDNDDEKDR